MRARSMFRSPVWVVACLLAMGSLVAAGAASAQVRIVVIGDSSVRGLGVDPDGTYPAQLERSLKKRGHNVAVANAGINGDTCPGVAARLDWDVPNGTHIVLLSVGANDLFRSVPQATMGACIEQPDPAKCLSSAAPSAIATISACVMQLVSRVRARGMAALYIGQALDFQRGTRHRPELHVVADRGKKGTNMYHLNARGYAVVVQQTLPQVESLVAQAARKRK